MKYVEYKMRVAAKVLADFGVEITVADEPEIIDCYQCENTVAEAAASVYIMRGMHKEKT